ncbi:hypothetical protein, partial [Sphingobacterium sp. 2149]|uniref:hypothetical protein n=1 Tax=Sphingobacterium sp. 2149 TaxID=2817763 RepID=UPI00285D6009
RWYCRNRWESRSVPFFTRKPLLETVKGFFRLNTSMAVDGADPSAMLRNRHCPQSHSASS